MLPRFVHRGRTRRALASLDDRTLRDIGIEPDTIRSPHSTSILLLSRWPFPR